MALQGGHAIASSRIACGTGADLLQGSDDSPMASDLRAQHAMMKGEDGHLLKAFEECTLPFEQWTHRTHVKVAFLYLRAHGFDKALMLIRDGIERYNGAHDVPDGPNSGYHETVTHALLHIIEATRGAWSERFETHDADAFCDAHPQLMSKQILRLFYSPQRLMSPEAKQRFLEPDLAALPARK